MMMGLFPRGAQILETPNLDTLASTIPLRKGGTKLINLPLSMLMVDLAGLLPTPPSWRLPSLQRHRQPNTGMQLGRCP